MAYMDRTGGGYEFSLRTALEAACRHHDYDLLVVVGLAFGKALPDNAAHNRIYDLVGPQSADAVIMVSAGLASQGGLAAVARRCEQYRPLPLCSLGMVVPGVPSVIANNRPGMVAVVEHVISAHRRTRIAFLGGTSGNPDARVRLEVFHEVMARNGLRVDPRLVTTGNFEHASGAKAVQELIELKVPFDALICANDGMAIGALWALKRNGLRVPDDVIVTGYDNVDEVRFTDPALTTVDQPLDRMAAAAVDLIAEHFAGRQMEPVVELESLLVVRHSCGCLHGGAQVADRTESMAEIGTRLRDALEPDAMGRRRFLSTVSRVLDELPPSEDACDVLFPAIADLRGSPAQPTPELDALWEAAGRSIAASSGRRQLAQRIQVEAMYCSLLDTGNRFSAAVDLPSLKSGLAQHLPLAHAGGLFIGLHGDGEHPELDPLFCQQDRTLSPLPVKPFAAARLLPPALLDSSERRTYVVLPITGGSRLRGVLAAEALPQFFDYQMLRDQIASSLRVVELHEEVLRQTTLHERSAQERQAAADRMRGLSVLAGGVAHDLNNALGSLVALSDVVLEEMVERHRASQEVDAELYQDLRAIKSSALHAAETIKDLMTLGRKGETRHDLLELTRVATNAARDAHAQASPDAKRRISLSIKVDSESLVVRGSEPHLLRAIVNLVRNGVESIDGEGVVVVEAKSVKLIQPLSAFETIPAGDYAVITVGDTGAGITPGVLEHMFEPFFTTKRLDASAGSGLGLSIVHSVVKEHDGYVDVTSHPGSGTRFSLYLPRIAHCELPAPEPTVCERGNASILVIDDDLTQLRTARRVLSRLGYEVTTVASGDEARALVLTPANGVQAGSCEALPKTSSYDLVIVDLALSAGESGLEIFRQIRAAYPEQKGLLASGHALVAHESQIREAGIAWLAKPYTVHALATAVKSALGGGAPLVF